MISTFWISSSEMVTRSLSLITRNIICHFKIPKWRIRPNYKRCIMHRKSSLWILYGKNYQRQKLKITNKFYRTQCNAFIKPLQSSVHWGLVPFIRYPCRYLISQSDPYIWPHGSNHFHIFHRLNLQPLWS